MARGRGLSRVSPISAFDMALNRAGIGQCNLVEVSSILPPNAIRVDNENVPAGAITFCVLSHSEGRGGEVVGAGIGWAFGQTEEGARYGIVTEVHGNLGEDAIKRELEKQLREMAEARGMKIDPPSFEIECMKVSKGFYGSVVVALVHLF